MKQLDMTSMLLRRYSAAQHPWGRFLLQLRVQQQRLRAKWIANGTEILKRTLDIVASFLALLAISPIMGLVALAVWLEDGGPIFFSQIRVGRYGKTFKMYKVRSMCHNAEQKLKEILDKNE